MLSLNDSHVVVIMSLQTWEKSLRRDLTREYNVFDQTPFIGRSVAPSKSLVTQ